MDRMVTEADRAKIATFLPKWKKVAEKLGVNSGAIYTIDERYFNYVCREKQRSEILWKWIVSDGPKATYGALYRVLSEMKELQAAKNVEELATLKDTDAIALAAIDGGGVSNPVTNQLSASVEIRNVHYDCWEVCKDGVSHPAYMMGKHPHGIALIISNTEFEEGTGLQYRNGGIKDEERLQTLFKQMDYKVVLLTNLRGAQIARALMIVTRHVDGKIVTKRDQVKLDELTAKDCRVSADDDSFVLCLMSHGEEGAVIGTDEEQFKIKEIQDIVSQCSFLNGKPTMVFIQACRGEDNLCPSFPKQDDFMFSFATSHGHDSFRDEDGSWYVRDLCSVFSNGYKTKDVESMVTEVHDEVKKREGEDDKGKKVWQGPQNRPLLRYKVYFNLV